MEKWLRRGEVLAVIWSNVGVWQQCQFHLNWSNTNEIVMIFEYSPISFFFWSKVFTHFQYLFFFLSLYLLHHSSITCITTLSRGVKQHLIAFGCPSNFFLNEILYAYFFSFFGHELYAYFQLQQQGQIFCCGSMSTFVMLYPDS